MALSNPLESFIWGEGGAKLSPEQIAQRRKVEEALLARGVDTSPVGHWTQGLARVANAMGGAVRRGRLDRAEDANNEYQTDLGSRLIGGVGGSSSPSASAATSGIAGELAATAPGSSSGGSSALPSSFLSAVDGTEGAGDYDTLYGHAQRNGPFAGTSVSNMTVGDALAFSDPSGPYAQSVKGQIGRVATPMGRYQIVGNTLRNAVGEMGLDPNTPFNAQTQDAIAAHLARRRIAGASTLDGKIEALRSEWHGFNNVPRQQMAQIVADLENGGGTQVASLDPAMGATTPEAAIDAIAPASGYVDPSVAAQGPAPVSGTEAFDSGRFGPNINLNEMPTTTAELPSALGEQASSYAPPLPAPTDVATLPATPVQGQNVPQLPEQFTADSPQFAAADPRQGILRALMGIPGREEGATGAFPPAPAPPQPGQPAAPQRAAMNPAIMEALTDPRASEQQRRIAGILLEQQMQQNDPLRQAQIAKLQRELTTPVKRDTTTINGRLVDAQTGEEIANFEDPNAKAPTVQKLKLDDGSEMAVQWNGQTGRWDPIDAPQGGGGIAPKTKLTESQSKLVLFQSLQTETQPVLLDLEAQFNPANLADAAARSTPIAGNFFKSEQGQIYDAAATAWAEGALRIATGAAATPEEMERTKKAYFAQPGDTPNTIAFKAQMREMYIRSIDRSLGNQNTGKLPNPSDFAKKFDDEVPPPEGIDPSDWEFMTPEERRLFQ